MSGIKTREQIVAEAKRIRTEITDGFNTVAHWNDSVRTPDEAKIDFDPTGKMARILRDMERLIASEEARLRS